jgi:hypothetical protein
MWEELHAEKITRSKTQITKVKTPNGRSQDPNQMPIIGELGSCYLVLEICILEFFVTAPVDHADG